MVTVARYSTGESLRSRILSTTVLFGGGQLFVLLARGKASYKVHAATGGLRECLHCKDTCSDREFHVVLGDVVVVI